MQKLAERKILVTGASRGIGAAIARKLATSGARVAVHYGSAEDAARTVCGSLAGEGHTIVRANLEDIDRAADLPHRAAELLDGLDIVVNNAGIFVPHDTTGEEDSWRATWDRTIAINLTAPAVILKAAVEHLKAAGGGHLVNITSRGAFRGEPEAPAYGAAKAGLNSLTQSLALKLAPLGIHAVAVAPGWVMTDMTEEYLAGSAGEGIRGQSPLNRTATAAEIAEVVHMAVSGNANAVTGAVIDVNCASYLR